MRGVPARRALDMLVARRSGHALAGAAARIERAELRRLRARATRTRGALGPRVIVRSSATFEDGAPAAAAGVLESIRDVPAEGVWAAVRAVWLSALTPLAAAYARNGAARRSASA